MIEPAGHRVLIKPEYVEEKTAGGIILAATTQQRDQQATMRGTVAAVGVNAWKAFDDGTPWAAVGDNVVFRKYAGEVVKDGDIEYRVINDEDCLCVINSDQSLSTKERIENVKHRVDSGFGMARPKIEGTVSGKGY